MLLMFRGWVRIDDCQDMDVDGKEWCNGMMSWPLWLTLYSLGAVMLLFLAGFAVGLVTLPLLALSLELCGLFDRPIEEDGNNISV